MRVAFLRSDKPREGTLAEAFLKGAARHGHEVQEIRLTGEPIVGNYDVACFVGVKSRELVNAHTGAGIPYILFDKGYDRHSRPDGVAGWEYWRVAVNAHQPTSRLDRDMPGDRRDSFGWKARPWRKKGDHIVLAGSSGKYHAFYGINEPTQWWTRRVRELGALTDLPLVYRPKPSWREAVAIGGAAYSQLPERLSDILAGAHTLVTHGSNCCFEAVLAGVPCVVLGDAVAKPISSTSLDEVNKPKLASEKAVNRWLANLAWWQWTQPEMHAGDAWDFIGAQIHG